MGRKKKFWIWTAAAFGVIVLFMGAALVSPQVRLAVKGLLLEAGDRAEKRVPILLYHHLYQEPQRDMFGKNPMALPVDTFRKQMQLLHDNGYQTITAEALRKFITEGHTLPDRCVLITFDDGYESVIEYAYPILKKYGFHAVIFAETSKISQQDEAFEPDGLQYLHRSSMEQTADVFEYGSHTHGMHWMDAQKKPVLTTMPDNEVLADLEQSKKALDTEIFAYPYGAYSQNTVHLLEEAGYAMGFDNKNGRVTHKTDLYRIPRYTIFQRTSMQQFSQIIGLFH